MSEHFNNRRLMKLKEDRKSLLEEPSLSIDYEGKTRMAHFRIWNLKVLNNLYPAGTTFADVVWNEITGRKNIVETFVRKSCLN